MSTQQENGDTARPAVCGAVQVLPPTLVLDALTASLPEDDREVDVMTDLRCEIGTGHPGRHCGAVRLLDVSPPGTVWTQWADWSDPDTVLVLPDCLKGNGEPPGLDDACTLFMGHPGMCSFDLFDPDHEAFLEANPAFRYLFERGSAPEQPPGTDDQTKDSPTG